MRGLTWAGSAWALLVGLALVVSIAGAVQFASGLAVPVMAEIGQRRLNRSFEQRLQASLAQPVATATRRKGVRMVPPEGAIARITVARLGVREVVLAGDGTHDQLAQAPAMIRRADGANPVTVLAAHRDTHFLFIRDLREGDKVTMQWVDGRVESYRITHLETVRWDRFTYPLDPARPLLALATCYPFGGTEYGGPLRRVAWGERV